MNNQRAQLIKKYLQHMRQYKEGAVSKGNMLVSPPGVGKTQFVHFLSNLLGIQLVTIEAPHIVEEKLINIPFLVTKPATGAQQQGVTAVKVEPGARSGPDNFDIQLADSYLFTQLVNAQHLTDQQYIQKVYSDANIKAMYEQLGGTQEKIPQLIADIRGSYRVILFIDEFFRTPSPTIAAILRTLLNKRIGMHQLPADTYVTYASNLFDTGDTVAKRQQNQRFNMFIMKPATKVEWFDWLVNKFKDDNRGVKLNMNIIKKFGEILVDEDISSDFETSSGDIVRASPRRWEQLLLYVNAAFPMEDEQDARSLITNVQINFLHYLDNEYHSVAEKVLKCVVQLINKEAGFKIKQSDVNSDIDWRHTLKHQIKIKQILGDNRSYVPVISGPPGIGKAQPLYSRIKTPTGWTTMGEIKEQEIISMPDGTTAPIIGIFPQGKKPIYRFTFGDGRTADACDEHLWKIKKDRESTWQILTTKQIKECIESTNRWMYIPLIIDTTKDMNVPIDPYLLGRLLGDGGLSQQAVKFTNKDQEIIDRLSIILKKDNYQLVYESKYDYRIQDINYVPTIKQKGEYHNIIKQQLVELGVYPSTSYTKCIPDVYKQSSVRQKEELLAGLIDTDGYINKQGAISISTSSQQLADDIQYIVRSIGGYAICKTKKPLYTYKGEKKTGKDSYVISIRYPKPRNLVKLTRKLDRLSDNYQYENLNLRIVSVDYVGEEEAQCIMVDHPDHLYITDNFVVTHNTANAASVAQELNLRLIPIDASEIVDSGEVIGLPAPNVQAQGKINVKFVASKLFKQIYDIIDHEDKRYKANLMAKYSNEPNKAKEEWNKYEKSRWKYLIFFDELNRAPPQVMNALRRVILEKNFGEKDSEGNEMVLPREAIVMAAINPTGEGTSELTHHMRDVMDIIPGAASWDRQRMFLESKNIKGVSQEVREEVIKAFELMASKFGFKAMSEQKRPFYWDVLGDDTGLYITPNDMSDIFAVAADSVQNTINSTLEENGVDTVTELKAKQLAELDKAIKTDIYEAFEPSLIAIFDTHELNGEDWVTGPFKSWVMKSEIGDALLKASSSKLTKRGDLKTIISEHLAPGKTNYLKDDSRFINYLKSKDHVTAAHEIESALNELVADTDKAYELVAVLDTPTLVYDKENDEFSTTDEKTSRMFNLFLEVGVALHVNGFSGEVFSHIVNSMDTLIDDVMAKLRAAQLIKRGDNTVYNKSLDVTEYLHTEL